MIVCLTGENVFGWQAELNSLVAAFVAEHGDMALERLDGGTASFDRLRESLQSLPFLAARKLVVLRYASANKQFTEQAEALLTDLPETTDVVLVEPKLDKRLAYYKFLKKVTDLREFAMPDEQGMVRWLVDTAKARGGSLARADAQFLAERIGMDQQLLAAEIDKLLLYDPAITRTTIELLTEPAPQSTVFELIEAAFGADVNRALALYRDQREQKVDPAQIIAMLTWQLRVLALIKTAVGRPAGTIAKEAKLSPYVVRKSLPIAARIGRERLKRLIADLLAIDSRSKREHIDLDEALQQYLLTLAG